MQIESSGLDIRKTWDLSLLIESIYHRRQDWAPQRCVPLTLSSSRSTTTLWMVTLADAVDLVQENYVFLEPMIWMLIAGCKLTELLWTPQILALP